MMVSIDLEDNKKQRIKSQKHLLAENKIDTVIGGVKVHLSGYCGSDHRVVTHKHNEDITVSQNKWGSHQPKRYQFTKESITDYDKAVDSCSWTT